MRWLAGVGAGVLAVLGGLWLFQRRLIYLATSEVPDPALLPDGAEQVVFETEDGLRLPGWFLPPEPTPPEPLRPEPPPEPLRPEPPPPEPPPPEPSPHELPPPGPPGKGGRGKGVTVLFLPGNAGNRSGRLAVGTALARAGFGVLLFDYRGYAGNPGSPSEEGLMADARAARAWLVARPDVREGGLVYFGESLGAAVAVGLAVEHAPAALVLRSPFTSLAEVAAVHYRFLPVRLLLWDRFPSSERISHVAAPVLVMLGEADEIVPAEMSRRLYDAAPEPKRLVAIRGAGHEVVDPCVERRLVDETVAFVTEWVRP